MVVKTELNVFSRHMGERFFRLPMLLQTVHTGKRRLQGYVTVSQGNFLARLICRMFKFPPSSNHTRLTVDCYHGLDHMEWVRCFDGHVMRSTFYAHNEFLVERLGLLSLYFKTDNTEDGLRYHFTKTKFLGVPLPKRLSPIIEASEFQRADRYFFDVRVRMWLVGTVLQYGGEMDVLEVKEREGMAVRL